MPNIDSNLGAPAFPNFDSTGGPSRQNRFSGAFPDPYLDYASTQMPRSMYDVLRWCEFVYLSYGVYRTAAQRVVRYFLTNIELQDASDDEKEKWDKFLNDELRILNVLAMAGDNFMAYGNEFASVVIPFRRYLRCQKCSTEHPIKRIVYTWNGGDLTFTAKCQCGFEGVFERVDRVSVGQDPLKIKHWPVHEIRLLYHPIQDKIIYLWEIPAWFKQEIRKGSTFYLEDTPWEIIEAIKNDQLFRFEDNYIYHFKEETISGVRAFGWGIPRIMGNFKQAWYIQVLKRYNEAIALDYIIPFRVITPKAGGTTEGDPLLHLNLSKFQGNVRNMLQIHRKDPTTFHFLPFPIELESLGADGQSLAPTDLLDKATDEFLNAQGVPAELYRGTLQWQAMPVALRLFERTWVHLVYGYNGFLNWILQKVAEARSWEQITARLQPVTMADDLEKKQIQLQLASGQQISRQTALAPFGINFREEVRKMIQEEDFSQEEMAKAQERAQQKTQLQGTMQAGAMGQQIDPQTGQPVQVDPNTGQPMPPGGVPPGQPGMPPPQPMPSATMGNQQNMTPQDLQQQAESMAYQLLAMPHELRRSELSKIKKANDTLHALVIGKINEIRQNAQTQGGFQALQQMVGGAGGGGAPGGQMGG